LLLIGASQQPDTRPLAALAAAIDADTRNRSLAKIESTSSTCRRRTDSVARIVS
jgi:hypothetical protein